VCIAKQNKKQGKKTDKMTYQSIKETNLAVDEGHHYDEQSKETTMMKSFTLSWKKVATVCATFVGCTVLYVLSTSGGHEGGGIANVDQLGSYMDDDYLNRPDDDGPRWVSPLGYPCDLELSWLQEFGIKDGIFDFEAEVVPHMFSNGRYVSTSRHQFPMQIAGGRGDWTFQCGGEPACGYFKLRVNKPTDWLEIHAEEVDKSSSSDWATPTRQSNLCAERFATLWSTFGNGGRLKTVFRAS